jgi:hypothetical protein
MRAKKSSEVKFYSIYYMSSYILGSGNSLSLTQAWNKVLAVIVHFTPSLKLSRRNLGPNVSSSRYLLIRMFQTNNASFILRCKLGSVGYASYVANTKIIVSFKEYLKKWAHILFLQRNFKKKYKGKYSFEGSLV